MKRTLIKRYLVMRNCVVEGDNRWAAEVFKKLTVLIPTDMALRIQIAEAYHCNEQEVEAVDVFKMCIEKDTTLDPSRNLQLSKYELNAVNMLADLYITLKKYHEPINVIHHLHARYAVAQDPDQMEGDPGRLPIDIAVKYGICHIFERDFATAETMFTHLFAQDVRVFGDLYLDVADVYIALGDQDREAATILQQLLGREEFPIEQIWINPHGMCEGEAVGKNAEVYDSMPEDLRESLRGIYLGATIMVHAKAEKEEHKLRGLDIFYKFKSRPSKEGQLIFCMKRRANRSARDEPTGENSSAC
ncbi:hypothetical protein PsorP6_007568 [Peronosclerospora sorghi]|uniref:Uncharacterized protein n=1 Tax=Peronosclerospora sorghi TaxID=230839 RepID=A0ACC0WBN8_9STRA|nr:hypothetical protein PsorP6_007568 [Peronosclerospora sorghi]